MQKTITLLIFLFISRIGYSQGSKISLDSLRNMVYSGSFSDTAKIESSRKLYSYYFKKRNSDSMLTYSNIILQKGLMMEDTNAILDGYSYSGNALKFQGDYKGSIQMKKKALETAEISKDSLRLMKILNSIGIDFELIGDLKNASKTYLRSLEIAVLRKDSSIQSKVYSNLGILHKKQSNFTRSFHYQSESMLIKKSLKDSLGIVQCYNNLGSLYLKQIKNDLAIQYYDSCLNLSTIIDSKFGIALSQLNLGICYSNEKDYINSEKYLLKALSGFEKMNSKPNIASVLSQLAVVKFDKNEPQISINYGTRAYEIAKEIGDVQMQSSISQHLANIHHQLKNYKKSTEYYMIYKIMNDSLTAKEKIHEVQFNDLKYKFDLKSFQDSLAVVSENEIRFYEQEIENQKSEFRILILAGIILSSLIIVFVIIRNRQKNKILKQKEKSQELEIANNEAKLKAFRAQINDHFLFNALDTINKTIDQNKKTAKKTTEEFMKLVRRILRNSEESEITLAEELSVLDGYIKITSARLQKEVLFIKNIDPEIDPEILFVPPLIFQPFIENSIIHGFNAFEELPKIELSLKIKNDQLIADLKDNGAKKHSEKNEMKRKSFGIQLVKDRLYIRDQKYGRESSVETGLVGIGGVSGYGVKLKIAI